MQIKILKFLFPASYHSQCCFPVTYNPSFQPKSSHNTVMTVTEDEKHLNCGNTRKGWRRFKDGFAGNIIAKEWFVGNNTLFISVSFHLRPFSLCITLYLFEHHYSFNPISLLFYHLSSTVVNMSFFHSSLLRSFCPYPFSCFYLRHAFPLCHPFLSLPSFSKIKSWVLSPPLSLKESCSPGESTGEMNLPSLFLHCGGCSGDNSEPTFISISRTAQRPARPPHPPPCITFHCLLFFQVEKRKPGREIGRSWEQEEEKDDLDLV